jgi:phosphatidylserine decarboxylase
MRGQHIPRAVEHSRVLLQGLSEHLYCRALDRFASTHLPPLLMVPLLRAYCRVYGVRTDELAAPFHEYSSFREFFGRRVRMGVRTVDTDPARLTSPVDGEILATGTFHEQPMLTLHIKGRLYTLGDLLGIDETPAELTSGGFVLFYLAPGDYHRFHSPVSGHVLGYDYLPGTCRPVNRFGRRLFPDLYVTNRRVVLWMRSLDDPPLELCLVLIGAMGVGRIVIDLDGLAFEGAGESERHERFAEPLAVDRGQEIGCFDLGSSAILIWSGRDYRTAITADEGPVRMGQSIVALGDRRQGEPDA